MPTIEHLYRYETSAYQLIKMDQQTRVALDALLSSDTPLSPSRRGETIVLYHLRRRIHADLAQHCRDADIANQHRATADACQDLAVAHELQLNIVELLAHAAGAYSTQG